MTVEKIKNHNNLVESRMIAHELEKFKLDMRKLSSKTSSASRRYFDSLEDDSEERQLLQALRDSEDGTFAYKTDSDDIVVEKVPSPYGRDDDIIEFFEEISCGEERTATGSAWSGSTATLSEDSLERQQPANNYRSFIKISTQLKTKSERSEDDDEDDDDEFFRDFDEIPEDAKSSHDDGCNRQHSSNDDNCYMCCDDFVCEYPTSQNYAAYRSMPNLAEVDLESLIKVTKFQSLVTVDSSTKDCSCCPSRMNDATSCTVNQSIRIEALSKSIEEAETEKLLIIRRMEIEEKNYQELVIMSNAQTKNINETTFATPSCEQFADENEQYDFISKKDRALLRRTFKDWLQKTTVAKILRTNSFTNEDRVKKINNFLNKVRLEHNKTLARREGSKTKAKVTPATATAAAAPGNKSGALKKDYEHKMKIQQDIIELQKLKIQRQERMITEMKLAKFSEMLKDSRNELKLELTAAKKGNSKLRAKARCIEMNAELKPDPVEEEKRKLLAQGLIVPRFLQKMQQRAIERLTRHAEAKERRERLEIEKEETKNAAELIKRQEDEETKRRRLNELRERRRQEKLAKLLREQDRQRYLENMRRAREHYERTLMRRVGFRVFELIIRLKRTNHKKSTIHRRKMCMKKCFRQWHLNAKIVWDRRRALADKCHEHALLRGSLKVWKHVHQIHRRKMLVAIDWYEVKITEKLFKTWHERYATQSIITNNKMLKAQAHFNW